MTSNIYAAGLVTFVVPTKNAARTIRSCLTSLRSQTHPDSEVVVVDNHSTDGTLEIARDLADVAVTFGPERSAQRNRGAVLARGDVFVFVDADMVVGAEVAAQCITAFARSVDVGALVVPEVSFGVGYFARCRALEKRLYIGDTRVEAARAFRREAFESVGGYAETLNSFEDWELADRVQANGWGVGRTSAQIRHDDGVVSPIEQFRKKRYYGTQSGHYLARQGSLRRRSLFRTSLFDKPGEFVRRPDLAGGLFWLKACEAAGVMVGGAGAWRARGPAPSTGIVGEVVPGDRPEGVNQR